MISSCKAYAELCEEASEAEVTVATEESVTTKVEIAATQDAEVEITAVEETAAGEEAVEETLTLARNRNIFTNYLWRPPLTKGSSYKKER